MLNFLVYYGISYGIRVEEASTISDIVKIIERENFTLPDFIDIMCEQDFIDLIDIKNISYNPKEDSILDVILKGISYAIKEGTLEGYSFTI